MNATHVKPQRNLTMEFFKLIASVIVLFNHIRFPGALDGFLDCLCRFCVPLFFAISGYFNYGATTRQIKRRFLHILWLNIMADLVHVVWTCLLTELNGGSTIAYLRATIPDPNELMWLLVIQRNSFLGHLWYLAAMAAVYLVFWVYTAFWGKRQINYKPWYTMAFAVFCVYFGLAVLMPVAGFETPGLTYRNGWLTGIPMFAMGMFVRQYQDEIYENYGLTTRRQVAIALFGIGLAEFQWWSIGLSGSPLSLPVGVLGLLLLCVAHPIPVQSQRTQKFLAACGDISTGVYLFHLTVADLYNNLLRAPLTAALGEKEPWCAPLICLALSLPIGLAWERFCHYARKWKKKRG